MNYYYKARYYLPKWGRFASKDPNSTLDTFDAWDVSPRYFNYVQPQDAFSTIYASSRPSVVTDPYGRDDTDPENCPIASLPAPPPPGCSSIVVLPIGGFGNFSCPDNTYTLVICPNFPDPNVLCLKCVGGCLESGDQVCSRMQPIPLSKL